jgi:hypothetical protein
MLLLLACCLVLGTTQALAQAQASTGQISGAVRDSAGAAVPNATVKVKNSQTGLERTATTSDEGFYRIVLLPPGSYIVSAEASGFARTELSGVIVAVGQITDANITVGVSGVSEAVTVTAEAVQTTVSQPDALINETAINNLPINGRRFQDFVTLTPTAQVEPSRGQISLSGQRGINSNINIDGVDYNQPFFGGIRGGERANNAFTIPQESIKEFQVVAAGYTAEFGRSSGGVITAVTKSGTNEFHGSAFYVNRDKSLAKENAFRQAAAFSLQQFGGSFGGPLRKDRVFFFATYEQQKEDTPRQVLFTRLAGFTPNADQKAAFDYYKSLETPFNQTNSAQAGLIKFDFQFNDTHRFNVRYNQSNNEALNANATGNSLFPTTDRALSNNGQENNKTWGVVGQLSSSFYSNLINELRAQYSREERPRLANSAAANVDSAIGNFGTRNFLPTTQFDWRAQVFNNLTWLLGNHSVKFGAEINHVFIDQTFAFNQFGAFSFSTSTIGTLLDLLSPGGSIANRFDTNQVTYRRNIGNGRLAFETDEAALYAQDAWRVRPNFTLNYGLRWEGQFNPAPDASNTALYEQVRNFAFPSGHRVDPARIPDFTDQFGPRLGFAWDPFNNGKTVIRAFSGVYYARTPGLLLAGPLNNFRLPAGDLSVQLPLSTASLPAGHPNKGCVTVYCQFRLIGIDLNTFAIDKLPVLTTQQVQSVGQALGLANFNPFFGAQPITFANDFKNPRSYQYGGGIEHQLGNGFVIGADYSQVNTMYLQRNRDINLPLPLSSISEMPQLGNPTLKVNIQDPAQRPFFGLRGNTSSSTPADQRYAARARPISSLGSIQVRESTARSVYQAVTFRANLRRKWGQFNTFYTLSRSLSNDDNERDAGGVGYENAFNLAPEFGYARIDRRHQFVMSPVFFLPGDIEASGAIRLLSGLPYDAVVGNDLNQDIGGVDRPYSAAGVPFKRNAFRDYATYNFDLRVQKSFKFTESKRLVFSAEFFNVFGLDNVTLSLSSTVRNFCSSTSALNCGFGAALNPSFRQLRDSSGNYLTVNNPGNPFQAQLGARFYF